MFKNKKVLLLLITILVLSFTLAGCGGERDKSTLVIAQGADAPTLDPHGNNDQPASRVSKQIYDSLIFATPDMKLEPALAKSWESIDPLTWEFKLEEGVKFHNDEELKASDVKFTFERMLDSSEVAHILGPVVEIKVIDDYTVRLITSEPFAPLLVHLTHTATSILNEKAVTEKGEDYGQHPIGTGPFKFDDWQSGDKIILKRFDDYFQEKSDIETVIFRNVPEGTNRTVGLETGEIDIAYDIEPVDKSKVIDHEKLVLIEGPSFSSQYLGYNLNKEPFNNKKVRQAINYAINVEEIIKVALEGAGEVANGPLTDSIFGANSDIEGYEYNPEKAKELLAEAGYADGFETTIWTDDKTIRETIATMVQAQLKEVGIEARTETVEWGAYLEKTGRGEHDMFILGWSTVTGDADYGLYAQYHSSQQGGAGNRTFFSNSRVDELLDIGKTEPDQKARIKAYKEAQEIIVEEAPQLFLYFSTDNVGMQKDIKGFKLHPAGNHSIYGVSFK